MLRRSNVLASWPTAAARVQGMAASLARPAGSNVERLISSPALARKLTGREPTVPLREGLRRTIDWVEANLSRYRADQSVI